MKNVSICNLISGNSRQRYKVVPKLAKLTWHFLVKLVRKNIFLHLWHVIAHWPNHVSRPRVQTNTPNYTFSSFCLHPTLIGLKYLIYSTLISVDNTAIHLHYHLHTHLCTAILHCDSRAGNSIGGADFQLLQSAGRSPYAVKRVWHNHFHPLPAPSALQLRQCRQVQTSASTSAH